MQIWKTSLWIILLGLLVGCAGSKPEAQYLAADFQAVQPRQLVLLEVAFPDPPLDSVLLSRAREVITRELAASLREAGYRVEVQPTGAEPVWVTEVRRLGEMPEVARRSDWQADALMHVQIDHFLWGGISEDGNSDPLDLYATAGLFAAGSGQKLWQARGHGRGWESGRQFGLHGPELHAPAQSLASSLFATLPPAR